MRTYLPAPAGLQHQSPGRTGKIQPADQRGSPDEVEIPRGHFWDHPVGISSALIILAGLKEESYYQLPENWWWTCVTASGKSEDMGFDLQHM